MRGRGARGKFLGWPTLSERSHKRGIQAKRKLAAWNDAYLLKLLQPGLPENQAD